MKDNIGKPELNQSRKEIADNIYKLFQSGEYDFWSIKSISRILNYDINTIKNTLLNDERFRESYFKTRDGAQTYTLKAKKIGFIEKIVEYLAVAESQFTYS